MEIKLTKPY